ncbi:MAG: L-seryl-tRNA(Sec) selenium transferase [Candidatus Neomarinimicrobiota bacterium]|nr:L-seryl-tRNA(Sec) selenium transferase [Candidatus Neomarinimicrobiota bacterium]
MINKQLKKLPSVSQVIHELNDSITLYNRYLKDIINSEIKLYRKLAQANELNYTRREIIKRIIQEVERLNQSSIKNIINGTGIVLHTGFGRAPISKKIIQRVATKLDGYINLEFDLLEGKRGYRQNHLSRMSNAIFGSQSSLLVNNNASAVLLSLNSLAEGKDVIVSRGQEVEIGGSFRIPDIIQKSHAKLVEVGTTNRTHLIDYEKAISSSTGVILWAHTSNYVVKGFTKEVSLKDLALLSKKKRIPLVVDLGSGTIIATDNYNLPMEKNIQEISNTGADIITFSGDKLIGGPQCGFIIGKKRYINKISQNPLHRTYRCDKWTIAFMEETLKTFQSEEKFDSNNLSLKLLTTSRRELIIRGKRIIENIPKSKVRVLGLTLEESLVEAGSGSLPLKSIPSAVLKFRPKELSVSSLAKAFRLGKQPVVGYTKGNVFYIDLKAVLPSQISQLIASIKQV